MCAGRERWPPSPSLAAYQGMAAMTPEMWFLLFSGCLSFVLGYLLAQV